MKPAIQFNGSLSGFWAALMKLLVLLILMLIPFGIAWTRWVTLSISELKSGAAVVEGRVPATTATTTSTDARLTRIQEDIAALRVLYQMHVDKK